MKITPAISSYIWIESANR